MCYVFAITVGFIALAVHSICTVIAKEKTERVARICETVERIMEKYNDV